MGSGSRWAVRFGGGTSGWFDSSIPYQTMIRKAGNGKYVVVSHTGKRLSKPSSHAAAVQRLREIEYFKHRGTRRPK